MLSTEIIKVTNIGSNGMGIGRTDNGKVCLIPYTLIDETYEIEIVENHTDYSIGKIIKILEESPKRIEPECEIFQACGGCNFLHMDYEDEIKIKKSILLDNLNKIGKLNFKNEIEVIQSKERFFYRNNVQIKTTNEGLIGFYAPKTLKIIPFPNYKCLLLTKRMQQFIDDIDKKYFLFTKGFTLRDGLKIYSSHLNYQSDSPYCEFNVNNFIYRIGISDFFQVNNFQLEKFQKLVTDLVETNLSTIELYGGAGFFSLPIAKKLDKLMVNELSKRAINNGIYNAEKNNINNIEFVASDAKDFIKNNHNVKQLIVDPPREGMSKEIIDVIINSNFERIIYVSCNPSTFSRDFSYLKDAGYTITRLFMIDNFPSTYHTELVALLLK